ncbi:MAG: hypothetical protein LBR48_08745 [Dysgonamonadaceae bacterium]|jgi:hypothetical protein|nr:hypothetical protein [Dysgonamonadaceae bacterium]
MNSTFFQIMGENYRRLRLCCLVGSLIYGLASCSEEDGDGASLNPGSITFTVGGIAQGGEEFMTRAALDPETVTQDLGDGLFLVCTLSADPLSATRSTTPMAANTKYRIVVYKDSDGSYVTEQLFSAGTAGTLTGLPKAQYKLAAYSCNTTVDPGAAGSPATTLTVDPSNDLLHWVGSVNLSSGAAMVNIIFKHRFPLLTVIADASLTGNNISTVAHAAVTPGYKGVLALPADANPAKGATAAAQTFSWTAPNAPSTPSNQRPVFTNGESPVTIAFTNLTVNAPSGLRSISPTVTFVKALLPSYKYTLTARIEASKGDYYPFSTKTGASYEAVIPIGTTYNGKTTLTFLTYNLGGDPDLTPKQQMAYPHTDNKNIRVYGGCYQWGRKDVKHSLRDEMADASSFFTTTPYTEATYNPLTDTKFVYDIRTLPGDWVNPSKDNSSMWGNGGGPANQANISYTNGQNINNPCPSGYRVPTQYEWSLIVNSDGSVSATASDRFTLTSASVYAHNAGFVWVRVSDGKAASTWVMGKMNGWALYATSVWNAAAQGYKNGNSPLTESAAPNPLMFLPAAGYRLCGGIPQTHDVGGGGYYWSSTVGDTGNANDRGQSYALYFDSDNIVEADICDTRGIGESVRCVKMP